MSDEGASQFLPFAITIVAIVLTDLLVGIVIGMFAALFFILQSSLKSPLRVIKEQHIGGEILRIEFANQVSFLNRATLRNTLSGIPHESQLVLDARQTDYMDPDIMDLIHEFEAEIAPAHQIEVSLIGFREHYDVEDRIVFVDYSTQELQQQASPDRVLRMLREGNERFARGEPIARDARRQVGVTSSAQYPLAVVLSCMDSRLATEMIFDLGLGDVFSVRIAGNLAGERELGSMEYGCAKAGAKLLLVLGHTRCGAVTATIDLLAAGNGELGTTNCEHLDSITACIAESVRAETQTTADRNGENEEFVHRVAVQNVRHTIEQIRERSRTLRGLIDEGRVALVGAIYDVTTGRVEFLDSDGV
jgi:carbonic anhydrase/SulP family sulfate permease